MTILFEGIDLARELREAVPIMFWFVLDQRLDFHLPIFALSFLIGPPLTVEFLAAILTLRPHHHPVHQDIDIGLILPHKPIQIILIAILHEHHLEPHYLSKQDTRIGVAPLFEFFGDSQPDLVQNVE